MRYIFTEPIITTIEDREISDPLEVRSLLTKLMEIGQSVQMVLENPVNPDYLKHLDNVRITAVQDNTVDLHVFYPHASAKMSDVPLLNIRKIKVLANKSIIGQKYKVSRWQMIDVAEIECD